jgi:hypothetical protein
MFRLIFFCLFLIPAQARWNLEKQWLKVRPKINYISSEISAPVRRAMGAHHDYFHRVRAATFLAPMVASGNLPRSMAAAALPDPSAIGSEIEVMLPATQKRIRIPVVDIGPYAVRDPYWHEDRGPIDNAQIPVNFLSDNQVRLGIALTPAAWEKLGIASEYAFQMDFTHEVYWRFLEDSCYDEMCRIQNGLYPPPSPFF